MEHWLEGYEEYFLCIVGFLGSVVVSVSHMLWVVTTKLLKNGESTDKLVLFRQEVSPFFVRIVLLLIMVQIIVWMGAPYIWRETNIVDATVNNPATIVLLTPFLLLGMNKTRLWFYSFVGLLICGAMFFFYLKI